MSRKNPPPTTSLSRPRPNSEGNYETTARGIAVLNSPLLNKGTAFDAEERQQLGLVGLLPPEISTLDIQVRRAYLQYERLPDALSKNIYLTALHDRNEVLFYKLFSAHLREMIPIVNDLTVGLAMEQYHHEYRPPRGIYLSIDQPDGIEQAFTNLGVAPGEIDLILATDAEQILGIGDWGVGGIEVAIGKLAIYTAAGGIDPTRVIPVMLDVGTNRESLLADPMYVGNRHHRVRGQAYDDFIANYVRVVTSMFPNAMCQWEDLAPGNSRHILETYASQMCTFNDDMQGTGAIALAALISAVRASGIPLRHQRIVIFGAGTAGIGIADQLRDAIMREGLTRPEATARFWCVDRQGLLTTDPSITLKSYQASYARPAAESAHWRHTGDTQAITLAEVVHRVQPTILIGASNAAGSFTEPIIRDMAAHTGRPIIFVLSIPPVNAEATPTDLVEWSDGDALIATGSAFPPVTYKGVTHGIAQLSNSMIYPGVALGVIVSQARRISQSMIVAAASAVSSLVTVRQPGASLLPSVDNLRRVSATVATAVVEAAAAEGLARARLDNIPEQVQQAMWQPAYRKIIAR